MARPATTPRLMVGWTVVGVLSVALASCGLGVAPTPFDTPVPTNANKSAITRISGEDGSIFLVRVEDPDSDTEGSIIGTVEVLPDRCVGMLADGIGEVVVIWPAGSTPVIENGQFVGVETPEGIFAVGDEVALEGGHATPAASLWNTVTEYGCSGLNRFFARSYPRLSPVLQ